MNPKMHYKYTEEGCFKGKLLKDPPLPADDPGVKKYINDLYYITRRWLYNGCAVEEMGRMGYSPINRPVSESAYVWRLHDLLSNPQPIKNNDGVGAVEIKEGVKLFAPRFVLVVLTGEQIVNGLERILIEYFGFEQLAPYFGNCEYYGDTSKMGLYGLCTTRYVVEDEDDMPDNGEDVA